MSDRIPSVKFASEPQAPIFLDYFADWDFSGEAGYIPHRHDYHEILYTQLGDARHQVDARSIQLPPQSIALVARGQIHLIEMTRQLTGYALGFQADFLLPAERGLADLLLFNYVSGIDFLSIPPSEQADFAEMFALLHRENQREALPEKYPFLQTLVHALLLRIRRLRDAKQRARSQGTPQEHQRYQDFLYLLEANYAT